WADSGRVWSLDAYFKRSGNAAERVAAWPLMLMRCQIGLIYASTALYKLAFPVWRDGSAVHWALSLNTFHRFPWTIPASAAASLPRNGGAHATLQATNCATLRTCLQHRPGQVRSAVVDQWTSGDGVDLENSKLYVSQLLVRGIIIATGGDAPTRASSFENSPL